MGGEDPTPIEDLTVEVADTSLVSGIAPPVPLNTGGPYRYNMLFELVHRLYFSV